MKLDANSFGIFNKQSGSAVFLEYGDFSGFKFRVRIPPKTTTVVGLLGKPDWDATNEWMDAFGNQLPQPIGGGYSSDAHMYGQEHWCIRDNRDSLFAYESATGYEAFGDCDKPPGSFNFTGADDSLECLCDGNYACQMDRILFGIDAALETLDFQARVFQQRGILSFAPNQIPAATPTVVVVTVDLRGEANSTLRTVSSFVLYQISVDSRENTTGALAELLDFGSGADLVEGDHVYSGVVMVDANSTVGFQALPVFDGSVSTDLALRTFAAIQVVKGVVSPEMKDCKASTNQ
ncbi:expressed unknown protein [Seminavis robusta]|nr:expressed unknown protein [Seminavis robusta]|eukprot:Sro153_g069610.1 n/a (292) ;mRNA; r:115-990